MKDWQACRKRHLSDRQLLSKVAREFPEAAHVLEAQQLDYLWRAISRPLGITRFEIEAYDMIASGAGVKDLDQARLKAFGERLGPQVEVDHRMGSDWRTITQVLKYPFSCTTYFFGALTALTLFGKHLEQGKAGAALAVDVFRAGSSMSPRELMLRAGVDICKPDCWKDAIFAIEKQVLSFEENLRRQGV